MFCTLINDFDQSEREQGPIYIVNSDKERVQGPIYIQYKSCINLLAFYHECRSLIGYASHYLFCDRK